MIYVKIQLVKQERYVLHVSSPLQSKLFKRFYTYFRLYRNQLKPLCEISVRYNMDTVYQGVKYLLFVIDVIKGFIISSVHIYDIFVDCDKLVLED